jgi:integrase/recombinase XerD
MINHDEGFKVFLNKKYSPTTSNIYYNEILNYLSNHPKAAKYKQSEVLEYIGALRNMGRHTSNINHALSAIKAWYKYLIQVGERTDNPIKYVVLKDKISRDIQLQDLLDEDELELLLYREEKFIEMKSRNQVIMSLLIYQALRLKEICEIKTEDIDLKKGKIKIRKQFYTNGRVLYMRENQKEFFIQYINEDRKKLLGKNESDYLLIGQRHERMQPRAIQSHLTGSYQNFFPDKTVTVQIIRQSVIANLLKKGKDIRLVQVFAGHKNPNSTEKYKQNNVDELQREIEKYHPLK